MFTDRNRIINIWLAKKERELNQAGIYTPGEVTVNPYEYPDRRMDDPDQNPNIKVLDGNKDPVVKIQTIPNKDFKNLTGSYSMGDPKMIRVNSPVFTTQPILSFTTDEISRTGRPEVRVIERGATPNYETTPFINPWTRTDNLNHNSLMDPDKNRGSFDPKGFSITDNYRDIKSRMQNMQMNIQGNAMDILLPSDVSNDFSGTKISIGGVPGRLDVRTGTVGYWNEEIGPEKNGSSKPIPSRPLSWDGNEDKE